MEFFSLFDHTSDFVQAEIIHPFDRLWIGMERAVEGSLESGQEFGEASGPCVKILAEKFQGGGKPQFLLKFAERSLLIALARLHMPAHRGGPMMRAKRDVLAPQLKGHFSLFIENEDMDDPMAEVFFVNLLTRGLANHVVIGIDNVEEFGHSSGISA